MPFVVVILNRVTQRKDTHLQEKVRLEEVASQTQILQTLVKERLDKLDSEVKLRGDEFRKDTIDVKTKLEFLTGKMQLVEYRLDKMNGVK